MKASALLVLIAATHIAFLFGAYGTGFFGLSQSLPYMAVVSLWLGASSVLAGVAYFRAGAGLRWLSSSPVLTLSFSFAAAAASLYAGVFLAFNSFGT
jgi:hypothetical protein